MNYINIIISILTGLAAAVPLVVALVKYIQAAVKEKNWNKLLELVMDYMKQAEEKFSDGSTRKEWVLAMASTTTAVINYDIDLFALSALIDSLCDLTKAVNTEVTLGGGVSSTTTMDFIPMVNAEAVTCEK